MTSESMVYISKSNVLFIRVLTALEFVLILATAVLVFGRGLFSTQIPKSLGLDAIIVLFLAVLAKFIYLRWVTRKSKWVVRDGEDDSV